MIYDVFLPFIIIFSIFSIIIILARKIPDISLEAEPKKDWLSEQAKKQHRATVLFCRALSIFEKTLRQLRIHILKLDAKIFKLIQYLRDKSAKKLEEINKLSYKSFAPSAEKKVNKPKPTIKPQAVSAPQTVAKPHAAIKPQIAEKVAEKDVLSAVSVKAKPAASSSVLARNMDILGYPSKISVKFQFKIEERKLLHIIAKNPKVAENYKKLGMLYYKNENFLDAEAAFNEYLKLNYSDAEVKELVKKIALENQISNKNIASE